MTTPERRRDPRIPANHPVKLKCEQIAGKYIPGTTQDISDGGAMLTLQHPRLLTTGQKVQIGIEGAGKVSDGLAVYTGGSIRGLYLEKRRAQCTFAQQSPV